MSEKDICGSVISVKYKIRKRTSTVLLVMMPVLGGLASVFKHRRTSSIELFSNLFLPVRCKIVYINIQVPVLDHNVS